MSQRAFAALGVSTTAVQLWEKGVNADTENLAKIAARLGYKLDELLSYLAGKPVPEPLIWLRFRSICGNVSSAGAICCIALSVFEDEQQAEFPSASLGNCQSLIFIKFC